MCVCSGIILCFCLLMYELVFFFFKQKTAYEFRLSLVGSEMCIRDSLLIRQLIRESDGGKPKRTEGLLGGGTADKRLVTQRLKQIRGRRIKHYFLEIPIQRLLPQFSQVLHGFSLDGEGYIQLLRDGGYRIEVGGCRGIEEGFLILYGFAGSLQGVRILTHDDNPCASLI